MKIVHTLLSLIVVIVNLIDLSSEFDCLPNGEPIPYPPARNSAFEEPFLRGRTRSPVKFDYSAEAPIPSGSETRHARPRSPPGRFMTQPTKIDYSARNQYELNPLESIRLHSYNNPDREFVLRRYTFPLDERLRILWPVNIYSPMPTQEQIVLATVDSDVFAILETSNLLAGLYSYNSRYEFRVRAKINMESGRITLLTKQEVAEIPVGRKSRFLLHYRVERINFDPQQH